MEFDLHTSPQILARTPGVMSALLRDLPDALVRANEGPDTWSPFDVVGHLVHGDRTDWMPRVEHLLKYGESVPFPEFDRFAQFEASHGKSLPELLDQFAVTRAASLARLAELQLAPADLEKVGRHPAFGPVTLGQLLSTWLAHDLDHLMQVTRCIGRQYADAVGPRREYLRVVRPVG